MKKNKKDKLIIKLEGGLGNQMFQYAYAKAMEYKFGYDVMFEMSFFNITRRRTRPYSLNLFNTKPKFLSNPFDIILTRFMFLLNKKHFNVKPMFGLTFRELSSVSYQDDVANIKPNTFICGHYQTEKYFKTIEKVIKNDFKFKVEPDEENKQLIKDIKSKNSISIHIRRGDYLKKRNQQTFYECSAKYYKRALSYIAKRVENPVIYVFSDDIKWVEENLKIPYEHVYVNVNSGQKSYEDMRLMSLCKHNIIANSTFSWWGAWLNENPDKIVICPDKWLKLADVNQEDFKADGWISMEI